MNNVQKYVVSRTLTKVDWNNSALVEGELADSVRELKESAGGEIAMSGSSTLVRSLLYLKLLDELNLLVHPVIVGRGKRHAEGDGDQRFGSPRLLTPPGRMWPGDGTENPGHSPRVSDE